MSYDEGCMKKGTHDANDTEDVVEVFEAADTELAKLSGKICCGGCCC